MFGAGLNLPLQPETMKILIGGIGNALLGDHGIGPFAIGALKSDYVFDNEVELVAIETSPLDLRIYTRDTDAVVLITAANFAGRPGDIRLFRKHEIPSPTPFGTDFPYLPIEAMPEEVLLIGMQGSRFTRGLELSRPVRDCIPHVTDAVLRELRRLKAGCAPKVNHERQVMWWDRIRRAA